jgi:hypothetical protein
MSGHAARAAMSASTIAFNGGIAFSGIRVISDVQ